MLSEFARTMVTDFPIQGILDKLVGRIVDVMPITAAGVTLIWPNREPHFVAASNRDALRYERLQTEVAEGPCLVAYDTGLPVSVPDLRAETRFPTFGPRALDAGLAAVFTFPLRHGDTQLGALDLYRNTPGPLSPAAMHAADTLAAVVAAYLLNAQSRSDLEEFSARTLSAALHDPLTGLPNRLLLLERLEHAFLRERRSRKSSLVVFLDLDNFKAVNDTHGHRVGDELLIAVAERLTSCLRPGDTLARLGGDEFVMLCEDLDHHSEANVIIARIRDAMSLPFLLSTATVDISAATGVAFRRGGDQSAAELLHDADLAMYRAKHHGVGTSVRLGRHNLNVAEQQAELADALAGAVDRAELHLEYQPIVAALDGRLTGVEALLRWTHPAFGSVEPSVLIPIAEQFGLIADIGQWVLRQAWTDFCGWQSAALPPLVVSVNLSAYEFMAAGFVENLAGLLDGSAADPSRLTLEVTESVFIHDGERAVAVLKHLKNKGVMLALDDFGTGYSSLSHLLSYPVDSIKIDRAFVAKLGHDPVSTKIMTSMIHLAHTLAMTVVAEGVETMDQREELAGLGCDSSQGFYFARPMSAGAVSKLIKSSPSEGALFLPVAA